jgi:hypothetical protein
MTTRIRQETVRFKNNFSLSGFERTQPAGSYVVETEEELITELSFVAYRRTDTVIRLPSSQLGGHHLETIDPLALNAALERDAALRSGLQTASQANAQPDGHWYDSIVPAAFEGHVTGDVGIEQARVSFRNAEANHDFAGTILRINGMGGVRLDVV